MSTDVKEPSTDSKLTTTEVVDFALERYRLGRSPEGLLFAIPRDHREPQIARELRSLRPELSRALWQERRVTVSRETLSTAIETLSGLADGADVTQVKLRASHITSGGGDVILLDLGDPTGRFIDISANGWVVVDPAEEKDPGNVRAVFRRSAATGVLPVPEPGGTRDELRELLGLDADDPRWKLVWGWLVAALFESVPRPILWALGPQGSGKSTRARMILSVLEPTDALGREPGRNERDDSTAAAGRFIPSWDNIGNVSASTSDWLCRIVTGVEISRRELYTDDSLRVSVLRRTGVATSIVLPYGLGPDALERLVLVEFERIADDNRRSETELWTEFRRRHSRILGALLDDVVGVLRHLPDVRREDGPRPRMADYAEILFALDEHTDGAHEFGPAYIASVTGVLADRAKEDPLTAALLNLAKRAGGSWEGTAATMLRAIDHDRPDDPRAPWPTSAKSLGAALRRGQETLRAAGLEISSRRSNGKSLFRLTLRDDAVIEDVDDGDVATVADLFRIA